MTDRRYDPNVTRSVQDPDVVAPQATVPRFDSRTRLLLEGPIVGTLLRLATPNVLVMFVQAAVGLIETYFVAKLGTDALAGVALVFPVLMLMQMMSAGAVGGGIMSAIARALGAGRRADADALVLHALAIAVSFGLVFMLAVLGGGRWLYGALGGRGASLAAALTYSNVVFSGAIVIWIFNSLANVIRGTGNMAVPAAVTSVGAAALIPLSPCLIFGWGPFPRLGVAGGAVAVVAYYAVGSVALTAYLWAGRSVVRLAFEGARFRWPLFRDILRVGAVAALITVQTNLTIAIATGFVGRFGPAAIAGYGTGSRLEYLLVPLVFGLGGPLVAMVGTNIGAGQRGRALRAAWIGAAIAAGLTEIIGLWAAAASGDARRRIALPADGRAALRPVRAGHGPLLRFTGRRTAAVAVAGEPDAAGDRGRRRMAGAAVDRQPVPCLPRAECGACCLRPDQRRGRRERRLVRPSRQAAGPNHDQQTRRSRKVNIHPRHSTWMDALPWDDVVVVTTARALDARWPSPAVAIGRR